MSTADKHTCRYVSRVKTDAYLGWVNALRDDGSEEFSNFASLQGSGVLEIIAKKLYGSGTPPRASSYVATVLSDYYGADFVDRRIIDMVSGGKIDDGCCSCTIEWNTAVVVILLLNRALNDENDDTHVLICQDFEQKFQLEIYNAFNFLATGTERPPPSDAEWKKFFAPPVPEHLDTPVNSRRAIRPKVLIPPTESPSNDFLRMSTPENGRNHRSSTANDPIAIASIHRSPVIEGRGSPIVKSTAKLREKAVEIQKLKRQLNEYSHARDLQAMEIQELTAKVLDFDMQLTALKRDDSKLRQLIAELQDREEKHSTDDGKIGSLQQQNQKLTTDIAEMTEKLELHVKCLKDKEKARVDLQSQVLTLINERDRLLAEASHVASRASNAEAVASTYRREIDELLAKIERLNEQARSFKDIVDEAHCQQEEVIKLRNDLVAEKTVLIATTTKFEHEKDGLLKKIQDLEAEIATLVRQEETKLGQMMAEFQEREDKNLVDVDKLQKQNAKLKAEVAQLTETLETRDIRIEEMEKNRKELQSQLTALTGERNDLQSALFRAEENATKSQSASMEYQREVAELTEKNEQLLNEGKKFKIIAAAVQEKDEENKKLASQMSSMIKQYAESTTMFEDNRASLLERIRTLEAQNLTICEEKRQVESKMEIEMQAAKNNCSLLGERNSFLERQLEEAIRQRDLLSETTRKLGTTLRVVAKRTRQESSRSSTSAGTFGTIATTSAEQLPARYDSCEDEGDVMLETPVEPTVDIIVRDACMPAVRDGATPGFVTPGRKRMSLLSTTTTTTTSDEEFKVPAVPPPSIARALKFQGRDDNEENWESGERAIEKLDEQVGVAGSPWDKRLSTLHFRNSLLPAHLKSTYPTEILSLAPHLVKEEDLKRAEFTPSPTLQSIPSRETYPTSNKNVAPKKPVVNGKSPRFLSKLSKMAKSGESKPNKDGQSKSNVMSPVSEQEARGPPGKGAVSFDIPNTPSGKKITGGLFSRKKNSSTAPMESALPKLRKKS